MAKKKIKYTPLSLGFCRCLKCGYDHFYWQGYFKCKNCGSTEYELSGVQKGYTYEQDREEKDK